MTRYTSDDGQWCRLEIMGHRSHVGRAKEIDALGGKMLRVCDETEDGPIEYGLQAIFSRTWLSDEAGEKASAAYVAEDARQKDNRAHGLKMGEIQRLICLAVGDDKLSYEDIERRVAVASPSTTSDDFKEALENLGLDRWPIVAAAPLYWRDPDNCPF